MAMLNNQMVIREIGKKWALGNVFVFCNKKKVENNKDTNRKKMQTSDLVQRVHVCANTFRHQHSSIIKNSQIYILYIYFFFQDRCKLCPHCYQMSNPPKYRSLIPAVWVWKYGTGSVILPVKICQVPEQKNMGLSENRGFPQNPMVHHGLSISKINRRKFRSETSDNMDSWKAEVRRVRRDKIRRKKR